MTEETKVKRERAEDEQNSDASNPESPPAKKLKEEQLSESTANGTIEAESGESGEIGEIGETVEEDKNGETAKEEQEQQQVIEPKKDEVTDGVVKATNDEDDEPVKVKTEEVIVETDEKPDDLVAQTKIQDSTETDDDVNDEATKTEQSPTIGEENTLQETSTDTTTPAEAVNAVSGIPGVPVTGDTSNASANTTMTNTDSMVEERQEISAQYIGRVIGKGGEMIRDLQARSGCRMDVDQNVPHGNPRILTYRGTRKTVDLGKQMVSMLCTPTGSEANLPLGEATRKDLNVPASSVGKIIGRGGEMIRELQSRSLAKIQVDHTARAFKSETRSVSITGTPEAVVKAEEMVLFLVANPLLDAMKAIQMLADDKAHKGGKWGSGPPYINMPNSGQNMAPMDSGYTPPSTNHQYGGYQNAPPANQGYAPPNPQQNTYQGGGGGGGYGGGSGGGGGSGSGNFGNSETEVYPTAKMYMGRIIGQKGVTINDLQKRAGCDIQINQDVPPGHDCLITIKGTKQGIETAKGMLREVIEMGPNHPYAGGGGQFRMNNNNNNNNNQGYHHQQQFVHMQQQQQQQAQQQQQVQAQQQQAQQQQQPPQYGGYQAPHEQQIYGQQQQQQAYGQQPAQQQYRVPHVQQQQPYAMPGYQPAYVAHQQIPQQQHAMAQAYGAPPPRQQAQQQQHIPIGAGAPSWKTATAADGQVYYYNEKTGETQWDKPAGMP